MIRFSLAGFSAAAMLAVGLSASAFGAGLQESANQAKAEGKLLVVAICPAGDCAAYLHNAQQAFSATIFRGVAMFAAANANAEAFASTLVQRERIQEPTTLVIAPDGKKIWSVIGAAPAAKIATSLDRGVCAATLHNASQIPTSFRQQNGEACKAKAHGVAWSLEPEVIRPL